MVDAEKHQEALTTLGEIFVNDTVAHDALYALKTMGVEFEETFYSIKARYEGKAYAGVLPVSVKKVKLGHGDPSVLIAAKHMLAQFLVSLEVTLTGKAPKKAGFDMEALKNAQVKIQEPHIAHPQFFSKKTGAMKTSEPAGDGMQSIAIGDKKIWDATAVPTKVPKQAQTSPGVLKLANAEAIGQKVEGTSPGSVYRLVASNDILKVAAKRDGTTLSIRVEMAVPDSETVMKIKKAGFSWKTSAPPYGSLHLDVSKVPLERVIGALLFGLNTKFDRMIQTAEEFTSL